MDLLPFNSVHRCPKCNMEFFARVKGRTYSSAELPSFNWKSGSSVCGDCDGNFAVEHMDRTCPRCGYTWAERVMIAGEGS